MWLIEPIIAGISVSLFNKFILNNTRLCGWCRKPDIDSDDDMGAEISAIDTTIHIHN